MKIGFCPFGTHHSGMDPIPPGWTIVPGFTTFAVVRNHWDAAVSWVFGLHMGLSSLFPAGHVFRFTRYALIGLWGTLGAPFVFRAIFGSEGKGK